MPGPGAACTLLEVRVVTTCCHQAVKACSLRLTPGKRPCSWHRSVRPDWVMHPIRATEPCTNSCGVPGGYPSGLELPYDRLSL
jgi:hypothetical protein